MPRNPQMRARFFVAPSGIVIPKAKPVTVSLRRLIFERDGWKCTYCSRPVEWLTPQFSLLDGRRVGHIDHVFPRARGGQNDPSNLRLLCSYCNLAKAADA